MFGIGINTFADLAHHADDFLIHDETLQRGIDAGVDIAHIMD